MLTISTGNSTLRNFIVSCHSTSLSSSTYDGSPEVDADRLIVVLIQLLSLPRQQLGPRLLHLPESFIVAAMLKRDLVSVREQFFRLRASDDFFRDLDQIEKHRAEIARKLLAGKQ